MTASWHELLGIPRGTRSPDLYEVLGLSRSRFDASRVDKAFAERMQRLDARRDPADKPVVDRAKEELLRARRVLKSPEARAVYEEDLSKKAGRAEKKRSRTQQAAAPAGRATAQPSKGSPPPTNPAMPRASIPKSPPRETSQAGREKGDVPSRAAAGSAPVPKTDRAMPRPAKASKKAPPATKVDDDRRDDRKPAPELVQSKQDKRTSADDPRAGAASSTKGAGSFLVGRTIDDKYEVLAQLGEGGMGTVYKARHKLLDKFVALKVLNPDLAFRENVRERFLREARAAMEFVHPNAIPLRDFGHTKDGLLYMTQDYSPGRSLRAILDASGKLDVPRALGLARQCLSALAEAHKRGIVHRDVKPENILVESDPSASGGRAYVARLCDFGIAKIVDEGRTEGGLTGGAVIGTPHYMAPEQAAGDSVDARADIYAMGCVLYEMLAGERVFEAETSMQVIMMQVTQQPEPPSSHLPGLSRALDALVLKALGKTPQSRYQTAEEFVLAIDQLGQRPGATSSAENPLASSTSSTSSQAMRSLSKRQSSGGLPSRGGERLSAELTFCDGCKANLPDGWAESRLARRVGTKTLCLACYAPIKAGKTCLGCLVPFRPGAKTVPAGKTKRLCESCASKGEYLRVCAGCDVLLPYVAFQRGEAFAVGPRFYCKDCHRRGPR